MGAEQEALKVIEDNKDKRQKELKEKWIQQEERKKVEKGEIQGSKGNLKARDPVSPEVYDMYEKPEIQIQERKDPDFDVESDDEIMALQTEALLHESNGSGDEPLIEVQKDLLSPDQDQTENPEKQSDQLISQNDYKLEEHPLDNREDFDYVVDGVEDKINQQVVETTNKDIPNTNGEVEKVLPVQADDSKELDLLLDILQKNKEGAANFTTRIQEDDKTPLTETKVDTEAPDELKLLIQILNQKHIPLEKASDQKEMDDQTEMYQVEPIEKDNDV